MTKSFGPDNNGKKKVYVALASITLSFMLVVSAVAYANAADRSNELQKQIRNGNAKNVILMIGDGMGDSEITIARNYEVGAAGRLAMDALPLTGAVTTYFVSESNPSQPDYDPD